MTIKSPFTDLIGACFKPHLDIYTDSIDRNLSELLERFGQQSAVTSAPSSSAPPPLEIKSTVFPTCADLFVFYKKCLVQCTQLSNGKPMYDLALIFKKYLREYALRLLEAKIPKLQTTTSLMTSAASQLHQHHVSNTGMGSLTKDLQNLSTAAGQVFHSLMKEGDNTVRLTRDELIRICSILTTAEYCLETVQQLEDKLKEKINIIFVDRIDLSDEKDLCHRIISNCIQLLVQDLENGCDSALSVMSKIQWHSIQNVGDQSPFVNTIISNFKQTIPVLRDNLATSRKYYTQFCHKFVNTFIPKYINNLYKCRPTVAGSGSGSDGGATAANSGQASATSGGISNNILGCEQLLLDTHSLKTVLLDLPSIGSQVIRKAPASYTKVVVKGMTKAEMVIKVCMASTYPATTFIDQYLKLLPESQLTEFHRILDMKGVRRAEQHQLLELFKRQAPKENLLVADGSAPGGGGVVSVSDNPDMDKGRIKKLENLIKKRLPN
jgi:vacuolar protein sorting-associated protein 53